MNSGPLIKIVAILLISCLVADPATATAFNHPLSPTRERGGLITAQARVRGDVFALFTQEALAEAEVEPSNRLADTGVTASLMRDLSGRSDSSATSSDEAEMISMIWKIFLFPHNILYSVKKEALPGFLWVNFHGFSGPR